nr:hypothetical protein [Tanacetum cinerariifolium]
DNGSFVDKIIFYLNRAPDSPSQSPSNINHYCYECGDPLDGIFCKRCTCKSCGKDAHIGYNCLSKVSVISNPEPCNNQTIDELPQTLPIFHSTFQSEAKSPFTLDSTPTYVDESPNKLEEKQLEEERAAKAKYWKLHVCYDDDDDEERSDSLDDNIISGLPPFSAITPNEPVLSTEEPDNSLSMGDEHLATIPATESDQFIKSSVENLIPISSESKGIPEHMCDVAFHDNSPPLDISKDQFEDLSESNEEFSSTDDDSFSIDEIDYVEALPPDSEIVSSKVDAFLAVEDESTSSQFPKSYLDPEGDMLLFESFLNDDHSSDFKTKSFSTSLNSLLEGTHTFHNSLPEFTTFSKVLFDVEYESDSSDDQSCSDEDVLEKIVSKPLLKKNPRKGQNQKKTGQKREAWRSREKSEAVTVDRARKTEENSKKKGQKCKHMQSPLKF